jgi:hypothetical protein
MRQSAGSASSMVFNKGRSSPLIKIFKRSIESPNQTKRPTSQSGTSLSRNIHRYRHEHLHVESCPELRRSKVKPERIRGEISRPEIGLECERLAVPHVSWSQLGDISENKDIQDLEALRLQDAPDTENQHFKTTNQHLNDAKDKSNGSGQSD